MKMLKIVGYCLHNRSTMKATVYTIIIIIVSKNINIISVMCMLHATKGY